MSNTEIYLRAAMSLIARQTFSPEKLLELVSARGVRKQMLAYNLCDGTMTQAEIASISKIDSGNFSKTVKQWIDDGILVKIESGGGTKLVHVYPLPEKLINAKSGDK